MNSAVVLIGSGLLEQLVLQGTATTFVSITNSPGISGVAVFCYRSRRDLHSYGKVDSESPLLVYIAAEPSLSSATLIEDRSTRRGPDTFQPLGQTFSFTATDTDADAYLLFEAPPGRLNRFDVNVDQIEILKAISPRLSSRVRFQTSRSSRVKRLRLALILLPAVPR